MVYLAQATFPSKAITSCLKKKKSKKSGKGSRYARVVFPCLYCDYEVDNK